MLFEPTTDRRFSFILDRVRRPDRQSGPLGALVSFLSLLFSNAIPLAASCISTQVLNTACSLFCNLHSMSRIFSFRRARNKCEQPRNMQCQLCQRVARALHPNYGYQIATYYENQGRRCVKLGSWQEIQENQSCSTCSLIAVLFNAQFQENECDPWSAEYGFWLHDTLSNHLPLSLKLESKLDTFCPSLDINPLSDGSSPCLGVLMDQEWVDLERVQDWIKSCDTMHRKCHCQIFDSGELCPSQGMYLISVSGNCLVEANTGDKYVALSYVWGAVSQQFRALKANLTFLRIKGSLSDTTVRDRLPNTIQRAMRFNSLLGLDLLRIDLLCIVQDDPVHAATQINNMASIYSNSYLTLCAADGIDANSGLLGVPQCSQPRSMKQEIFVFTDGLINSSWVRRMHGNSVYDERGWTFQEKVLSRRMVSFTNQGLEWRCQEVVSQEQDLRTHSPASISIDLSVVRADTLWPCLKKWDNLVSSYLKRRLTYEEDILRAFSGVLGALDGSMSEGFHFGLPQQFFDAALLWVPNEPLTRHYAFPSWSWAGWKGARENQIDAFGLGHVRSDLILDDRPRRRDIFPCVSWSKVDMDTFEKAKIPNNYAEYLSDGLGGTVTLPFGWCSRSDQDDGPFYYKYNNAPYSQTFWYPIPTARTVQPASKRQWGPILNFNTLRGYLEMGGALPQEEQNNDTYYPLYSLNTETGAWAGVIYVHDSPDMIGAQEYQCELVLISGGFAFEHDEDQISWLPEWTFPRRPRSGDNYLFYHLWIEWQGGIAYRRGLARVVQEVWDELSKDKVEIFLG